MKNQKYHYHHYHHYHHFHHQQTPLVTRSGAKTLLDKWRDLCGLWLGGVQGGVLIGRCGKWVVSSQKLHSFYGVFRAVTFTEIHRISQKFHRKFRVLSRSEVPPLCTLFCACWWDSPFTVFLVRSPSWKCAGTNSTSCSCSCCSVRKEGWEAAGSCRKHAGSAWLLNFEGFKCFKDLQSPSSSIFLPQT